LKRIGITLRVVNADNYLEKRDAISHDWIPFLENMGMLPVFIPNTLSNVESFVDDMKIDGIILSGGDNIGDDPERDKTEKELIDYGIKKKIPIFGVCRGMQVINKYFDGSIIRNNDGKHVGNHHKVKIMIKPFSNVLKKNSIDVNSYHNNTITDESLGKGLKTFAKSEDNTIEGFIHEKLPIIGVMWHPEREPNVDNKLILGNTFTAKLFWSSTN
jgi:putative glutamine amidotransferase